MQRTVLPLGLLEYSLAHVQSIKWGFSSRNLHQAVALAPSPPPPFESAEDKSVFSRRRGRRRKPSALTIRDSGASMSSSVFKLPTNFTSPMSELEGRVLALQNIPVPLDAIDSQSLEASPGPESAAFPRYTDEELFSFYEDLLETAPTQQPVEATEPSEGDGDTQAIIEMRQRVRICMQQGDLGSAERAIELMKLSGDAPPEDIINIVLGHHALQGNIERFEGCMANLLSGKPSETQRDLHIKSYLRDPAVFAPRAFPTRAIDLLHKYEASGLHAPMKSYTRVISSLFSVRPSPSSPSVSSTPEVPLGRLAAHSQAWDLFAHMRYVAHPTPDVHLYSLMIRACASAPLSPEPERALDLWTEMLDAGIVPTEGAYDAVIRACAKAGGEWVSEAIRGVQLGIVDNDGANVAPAALSNQEEQRASTTEGSDLPSVSGDVSPDSNAVPTDLSDMDTMPSFSHLPPQSPGEVLAEARALFDRILQDTNLTSHPPSDVPPGPLAGKFNIALTPRLLNAYILFSSGDIGLMGDSRTYVDALEKCALSKSHEREVAGKWVDELWTRWEELEHGWINGDTKTTVTARLVERAHTAVRRVHLLTGNVDRAIALVRTFMSR
ncbi:uncharacterized protein EDB91DRAFT_1335598 [Suillus paluster]|uniref:uncharacterized protein n=1 Tax=Suillus paluster TaxID=48578 RepID=UPI001B886FA2|nr:uncharacterized protein EDB91DRAFT_1335598 [Suillus paluster]KAG1744630.1 hypothetical protein EDB91DRAFT_1335598 [Suillus paluster]